MNLNFQPAVFHPEQNPSLPLSLFRPVTKIDFFIDLSINKFTQLPEETDIRI